MEYLIITLLLFVSMLIYFKIADKYNIIDKPNHRSAHTIITLRGGGIIFPVAFILFYIYELFFGGCYSNYTYFGIGLLTICIISFIDDITDLSSKVRLIFHFISVTLLLLFLNAFVVLPFWAIPLVYIIIIGILNAYNFMDGINGMTGLYSLITLLSLLFVNQNIFSFTDQEFIIYPILACLVFLFFNFRKKAKCFMGDIGSMGIAYWVIALIGLLMIKTGELKFILLLSVYGTEVVITILERLKLKENIFEAHRRHLYQLFANEKKVSHLIVSSFYASIQLITNILIIFLNQKYWLIFAIIVLPTIAIYIYLKYSVKKELFTKII